MNLANEEIEVVEIDGIKFKKLDEYKYIPLNQHEAIKLMKKKFENDVVEINSDGEDLLDFESYRQKIIEESQIKKDNLYKLTQEVVEKTTYRKGQKTKEVVNLPMPTKAEVLKNKEINLRTYGAIMLESNWGGKFLNPTDRYIYNEKLDKVIKEVASDINVSQRTMKTYVSKLKKCNVKIFEPVTNKKGELFYKLNYADENFMNFTLIHDKALRKLTNAYSENALRIYLVMLYKCFEKMNEDKSIEYKECELTQEYLCKRIGLKPNSRKIITDCIEALCKGGFIKVRLEYKTNYETKNGEILNYPIQKYFYSISRDYMKKNHIQKS